MNSAIDHGYGTDWAIKVAPGLVISHRSAEGIHEMKVLRRHHDGRCYRDWECVWLDGPRARGIWIRSEKDILADAYEP